MGKVYYAVKIWESDIKTTYPTTEHYFNDWAHAKRFAKAASDSGAFYELVKCEVIDQNGE